MSEHQDGFCDDCFCETKEDYDLRIYYCSREELNKNDSYIICEKCWRKRDKKDREFYEDLNNKYGMNIIIQPLTWENPVAIENWTIYTDKKEVEDIIIEKAVEGLKKEEEVITAVEIKEEPKTTIINNINYINNYFLNPKDNEKANKAIHSKLEKERKLKEKLEKLEKERLEKELKEKEGIENQRKELSGLEKFLEKERINVEKAIDEEIENQRKRDIALNDKIMNNAQTEQNRIARKIRNEEIKYQIEKLEEKYGKNISGNDYKYEAIQTDEELRKDNFKHTLCGGDKIDTRICQFCKMIKAHPNDFVNKNKKEIIATNSKGEYLFKCYDCLKKKSDKVMDYRERFIVKCDKCNCKYYCSNREFRIKHEESEECINGRKKNKLINGKKYTVMELRKICKYNDIKNYKNMKKEEILSNILSLEKIKIPEDL